MFHPYKPTDPAKWIPFLCLFLAEEGRVNQLDPNKQTIHNTAF